jgi:hypothetical protein
MNDSIKNWLKYGGAAVALAVSGGVIEQVSTTPPKEVQYVTAQFTKEPMALKELQHQEIAERAPGQEIKSLRDPYGKTYKTESVGQFHRTSSLGGPVLFVDPDGDSLMALDLTVHDVEAPEIGLIETVKNLIGIGEEPLRVNDEAVSKSHDQYVKTGTYSATWKKNKPWDYTIWSMDGQYHAGYEILNHPHGFTIETTPTEYFMKQNITVEESAGCILKWRVDSTSPMICIGNGVVVSGQFTIQAPVAWDADSTAVPVLVSVAGDTLTYELKADKAKWPITVDPTTQITSKTGLVGAIYGTSTTYLTARNGAGSGTDADLDGGALISGQYLSGSDYLVIRGFVCFPAIPAGMITATACTLYVDGRTDLSVTDFDIDVLGARSWKSVLTIADFTHFNGWAASGNYSGTILGTMNTSAYSADWNKIIFNAAGLDSLKAASGDSLWLALLSGNDYIPTQPSGNEYVRFTGGTSPYISYTYTSAPVAPSSFANTGATTSTLSFSWTDNSSDESGFKIKKAGGDTATVGSYSAGATTGTVSGLSLNTRYGLRVLAWNADGWSAPSDSVVKYTLAAAPSALVLTFSDSTLCAATWTTTSNPAGTLYALRDSTNMKWFGGDGMADTTGVAWMTYAQWTALTLNVMTDNLRHYIGVVAKNGDGVQTAYAWTTVTAGNIRKTLLSTLLFRSSTWSGGYPYTTARGKTDSGVLGDASGKLGQCKPGGYWELYRIGAAWIVPPADSAYVDSLIINNSADHSITDFFIDMIRGTWIPGLDIGKSYFQFVGWRADSLAYYPFNNRITATNTTSYASRMPIKLSTVGHDSMLVRSAPDTVKVTFISSRDSTSTVPSGDEYITVASMQLKYTRIYKDHIPTYITVTATSPTQIYVTWLNNSPYATRFRLVDQNGTALGGDDSTTTNEAYKYYNGLSPNTYHRIAVKVIGGKIDGDISTDQDSCWTDANVPSAPTRSNPAADSTKIVLNVNSNPSWTCFSVFSTTSTPNETLWVDFSTAPPHLRSGPVNENTAWAWRTYAQAGGANGFTMKTNVGKTYTWKAWALSGQ